MSLYSLDPKLAKKADGGDYITMTGKYIGRITKAEEVLSKKNTQGVDFSFEAQDGAKANYMTLWTVNQHGETLSGLNALNAMMTCMKVKEINTSPVKVKDHDGERMGQCFVQLHKPIGLLLAKEPYDKNDGAEGYRMVIEGVFDPETELTASEILDRKTQPQKLAQMVARLKDRAKQTQAPRQQGGKTQNSNAVADLDDSIPF